MSEMQGYDDEMVEWLEQRAREDEAHMDYDEEYEIRRAEMREEMEYHTTEYHARAQEDHAAAALASETCPLCGSDCGLSRYEPADPSVGIDGGVFVNECQLHGAFYTYDDGTQEMYDDGTKEMES